MTATKGPATLRSPRTRAVELGTVADGFSGAVDYFPQGGHPITPATPRQEYADPVCETRITPQQLDPMAGVVPFTLDRNPY